MEQPLYKLTAVQAIALIRQNKLTVEAYARSLLSRVESREPVVKAWAYLNPETVLAQARQLDSIPVDRRGPLHGVAIGVKDVIYTKDMPTEHNSSLYKNSQPEVDAASIAILRQAGALIFGKTTTTEFAATIAGPQTTNPHDETRTPGGSSSGSGAAVADYHVPIALGTQTGGSTIRPGSFNGIYAMKPTWNAISREGQKVYSLIFDTIGLFARASEDLELLAGVFALEDDDMTRGGELELSASLPSSLSLSGNRFGVVKTCVWSQAGEGTAQAMETAMALLREQGALVEEVDLPVEFNEMPAWHAAVMAGDGRVAFLPEYRMDRTAIHPSLVGHVENVGGYSRRAQLEAFDGMARLRPVMDEIAGRYTALLTPSVMDEAPVGAHTGSAAFNTMWTALHTPVINIPGFQGVNGMPIGLSLVAPRYQDRHLIRVAHAVGKVFESQGGWKSAL